MQDITTVPDNQRRHLAQVYASLRAHIDDELQYDRYEPGYHPLDDDVHAALYQRIYAELTALMFAAHAEEAAMIQDEIDAYQATFGHE